MRIYLCGPMRGLPNFGFDRFDAAAARLRALGHEVFSPAELDRQAGFNETTDEPSPAFLREAMERDVIAICRFCDTIALLPGWEQSQGVKVELAVAKFLGLRVIDAETLEEVSV